MADLMDIERRIRTLENLEAIKTLKHRYWRCLDLKLWDEMAGCFTPDATVDYGGGTYRFQGVEAILRFLRESLGRETGALGYHHGHHPEIELTGETTARGVWALDNYLFNAARKRGVRIAAYYDDRYLKADGEWRIAHTGYTYVFHEEWSRDDTPSLRLLAP
jgi:bile-acid 7alpha-dehydratase